jgi:Glutamine amidotransferases class-II
MCVIIARNPGVEIDPAKIESACQVNPDGFGISVLDRGKLVTSKYLTNNSKTITQMLEEAKDHKVFLHLRFRTHGEVNMENCHPFTSFEGDGKQILFMHNGTVSDYGENDPKYSDTYQFNERVIKPMIDRWVKLGNTPESIFDDPMFIIIMQKYAGTTSKFVLYDESDNQIIFNKKGGKEFDGWWASNDYSFNRFHRAGTGYYDSRSSYEWWKDRNNYNSEADKKGTKGGTSSTNGVPSKGGGAGEVKDNVCLLPPPDKDSRDQKGRFIGKDLKSGKKDNTIPPPDKRETFLDVVDVESLAACTCLS